MCVCVCVCICVSLVFVRIVLLCSKSGKNEQIKLLSLELSRKQNIETSQPLRWSLCHVEQIDSEFMKMFSLYIFLLPAMSFVQRFMCHFRIANTTFNAC